jgi:hypothetical protein
MKLFTSKRKSTVVAFVIRGFHGLIILSHI